ncbi:MAG: lysophospholipid acyltransferase family protein [Desulfamplus sp.]|nr:lysophospholipid acyltransferase family protein [Desulfamplus sp.]
MNYTIFDTPIVKSIMHWLSRFFLYVTGWKAEGKRPNFKKYVLIAAPHTSNWDFVYTLLVAFALKINIHLMGKQELLKPPFGPILKWLGVIPIDRSKSNNMVTLMIQTFDEHEELAIVIPPTGTRQKVMYWKSGFYHIAKGANIPIVMGFIDYGRKTGGLGPYIIPTGDIEFDMLKVHAFYADITAKYPEKVAATPIMNLSTSVGRT